MFSFLWCLNICACRHSYLLNNIDVATSRKHVFSTLLSFRELNKLLCNRKNCHDDTAEQPTSRRDCLLYVKSRGAWRLTVCLKRTLRCSRLMWKWSGHSNNTPESLCTRMSGGGLGPAGCWITHKGLETWARMAKERTTQKTQVGAVNSLSVLVCYNYLLFWSVKTVRMELRLPGAHFQPPHSPDNEWVNVENLVV